MARGWESKSVESQVESAQNDSKGPGQSGDGHGPQEPEDKKLARERQGLLLSRSYLLHRIEASSNERYTESLRQALKDIDDKLAQLK